MCLYRLPFILFSILSSFNSVTKTNKFFFKVMFLTNKVCSFLCVHLSTTLTAVLRVCVREYTLYSSTAGQTLWKRCCAFASLWSSTMNYFYKAQTTDSISGVLVKIFNVFVLIQIPIKLNFFLDASQGPWATLRRPSTRCPRSTGYPGFYSPPPT